MAATTITRDTGPVNREVTSRQLSLATRIVSPVGRFFASLKLTVVLFALSVALILIGTLAQVDKDVWQVLHDYFYRWICWVDFKTFLPPAFFPPTQFPHLSQMPGGFWFPGGILIGLLLSLNLIAAHVVRFQVQARGLRRVAGVAVLGLGAAATWLIIQSGHNPEGLQGLPIISWDVLWQIIVWSLMLTGAAGIAGTCMLPREKRVERWLLGSVSFIVAAAGLSLVGAGESARLDDSSMRILWQLTLGLLAGVALLIGCWLLFARRAGIVLLHGGIGLLMFSQLLVAWTAVEGRMTIREGETVNYTQDIRSVELAVIDTTHAKTDRVTVIPGARLKEGQRIHDTQLPFDILVRKYFKNHELNELKPGQPNLATAGLGRRWVAKFAQGSSGADSSGAVDMAAAYVELFRPGTDKSLGTYLLSQWAAYQDVPERVTLDGKTWDVYLRFKRDYKDYSLHLKEFRKDDYLGTSTARSFSSDVRLVDPERNVDREIKIWMNNPLRYAGETFYQSDYRVEEDGTEVTILQVVTNSGWMIPYVACMIIMVGMGTHFSIVLIRFLYRLVRERGSGPVAERSADRWSSRVWRIGLPVGVVLVAALLLERQMRPQPVLRDGMHLDQFAAIPVVSQGRAKPMDTLARNALRIISERETFVDAQGNRQPAIRWLLDVIARPEEAEKHRVFRIHNLELLKTLDLAPRKYYRYSVSEFRDKVEVLEQLVQQAHQRPQELQTLLDRKLLELDARIRTYTLLQAAFRPIPYPPLPTEEQMKQDPEEAKRTIGVREQLIQATPLWNEKLEQMHPPLVVPVANANPGEEWQAYAVAWNNAYLAQLGRLPTNDSVPKATQQWSAILTAYGRGDAKTFNREVASYLQWVSPQTASGYVSGKNWFEYFFNGFQPFFWGMWYYVLAFVITGIGWLLSPRLLNRVAFWWIVATLVLHTFAIAGRIYISGRPPITNLYSTAIFIGWAAAVFGVVIEMVYRIGIGNAIASVAGFTTLLIGDKLADLARDLMNSDTMAVLVAVLDTQFWLTTHVITINLGYAATMVAGLLGCVWVLAQALDALQSRAAGQKRGTAMVAKTREISRLQVAIGQVPRMIYGTLCFAIFFSFIGTILGGLWADDSWGRFWGWDPKENGALIIVLWNALVLHARWGGMVRQRGLTLLAIAGNIATTWSWFGVNQLGIGLHSYGFTDGVLRTLFLFILSQLMLITLGLVLRAPQRSAPAAA